MTSQFRRISVRVGAVAAALMVAQPADLAQAQDATPQAFGKTEIQAFSLPAQPLTRALTAFAKASGVRLAYDANLAKGRQSPPLDGTYTPEQALAKLLEGTTLVFRFTENRTVAIFDRSAMQTNAQGVQLETINVDGDAAGPVNGYVASRGTAGTKTNTPLIETPQSISVVSRDQMEAQGVKSVSQSLGYVGGVVAEPRGAVNGYYEFPYIRGFSPANFMYQDGLQVLGAVAGLQIDPYGLERIEVLKGPSSILYGQGSPAGIVNLVSKMPTATPFNEVAVQGGTWNRKQAMFDLSGPVPGQNGEFLYRLTGLVRDSGTQVDFTKDNKVYIAPAFTWRPTADTSLTLLTQYQKAEAGFFNWLPAVGTLRPNPNGQLSTSLFVGDPNFQRSSVTQASIGYQFEHRFNDTFTVRQNYRHTHLEVDADTVFSGGNYTNAALTTVARTANLNRDTYDTDAMDTQLQTRFNIGQFGHTILTGLDMQRSVEDKASGNAAVTPLNLYNPVYFQTVATPAATSRNRQYLNQVGGYVQDQIKWDRWRFLAGIRSDFATTETRNLITNGLTTQSDAAVTRRFGALYLFDNGIAPYVSYSQSFAPTAGTDRLGAAFRPTTGRQYEGGIKYQPNEINALFTVAAFDITRQNVTTPDPVNPLFSVQTGEVTSRGFEFEGKMSLGQGWDFVGAYTYLDTRVTRSNGTDLGKRPVGIPYNTLSGWLDYTFKNGSARGFGLGAGVRYIGSAWGDTVNTLEVPSYALVDAALHYDLEGLDRKLKGYKFVVNATNVFDKTYVASCLSTTQCYYGLRRTVLGTLKYQW